MLAAANKGGIWNMVKGSVAEQQRRHQLRLVLGDGGGGGAAMLNRTSLPVASYGRRYYQLLKFNISARTHPDVDAPRLTTVTAVTGTSVTKAIKAGSVIASDCVLHPPAHWYAEDTQGVNITAQQFVEISSCTEGGDRQGGATSGGNDRERELEGGNAHVAGTGGWIFRWHPTRKQTELLVQLTRPPARTESVSSGKGGTENKLLRVLLPVGVRTYPMFAAPCLAAAAEEGTTQATAQTKPKPKVLVLGETVRSVERLELYYPADHFIQQGIAVRADENDEAALEVQMVFHRLAEQDGGGWVFEQHPDGRTAIEEVR
jgi:hypothetical protein